MNVSALLNFQWPLCLANVSGGHPWSFLAYYDSQCELKCNKSDLFNEFLCSGERWKGDDQVLTCTNNDECSRIYNNSVCVPVNCTSPCHKKEWEVNSHPLPQWIKVDICVVNLPRNETDRTCLQSLWLEIQEMWHSGFSIQFLMLICFGLIGLALIFGVKKIISKLKRCCSKEEKVQPKKRVFNANRANNIYVSECSRMLDRKPMVSVQESLASPCTEEMEVELSLMACDEPPSYDTECPLQIRSSNEDLNDPEPNDPEPNDQEPNTDLSVLS